MMFDVEPADVRTLEFEAIRDTAAGAKLRLTCSHWLRFDKVPIELAPDQQASRVHAVVILPQHATNDINPPGATIECRDFLTFRDLRAFHRWLSETFSTGYEHYTPDGIESEFVLAGDTRSLELRFRSGMLRKKCKMSIIGRISDFPLQRDDWDAHWKWATESPKEFDFAYASDFSMFFDPECLRLAARQLGAFLRVYGPIEE